MALNLLKILAFAALVAGCASLATMIFWPERQPSTIEWLLAAWAGAYIAFDLLRDVILAGRDLIRPKRRGRE